MTKLRALFLAALLGGLALVACGGAGSGPYTSAAPSTARPALATNAPATSPMPSGDPYSGYGY